MADAGPLPYRRYSSPGRGKGNVFAKGHPLWKFNNAIITPHVAGRSDQDNARMVGTARENIKRFAAGQPLINVVDKQKGY